MTTERTPLTDEQILSNSKYQGNDNSKQPRINYVRRIEAMDDADLSIEAKSKLWLSAYANNNRRSDYHWHVDAIYDEMHRRDPSDNMYQQAYDKASAGCS